MPLFSSVALLFHSLFVEAAVVAEDWHWLKTSGQGGASWSRPCSASLALSRNRKFNIEDQITYTMEILRIVVHPQKNFSQKENTVKKKVVTFSRNETFCMRFHCQFVLEQAPQTKNDSANQKTFWATHLFFPTINSSNISVPKNDFSLRRKEFFSHLKFRSYAYHLNRHDVQFS